MHGARGGGGGGGGSGEVFSKDGDGAEHGRVMRRGVATGAHLIDLVEEQDRVVALGLLEACRDGRVMGGWASHGWMGGSWTDGRVMDGWVSHGRYGVWGAPTSSWFLAQPKNLRPALSPDLATRIPDGSPQVQGGPGGGRVMHGRACPDDESCSLQAAQETGDVNM